MGQLDEAIRAHLELKRKHGASEEELHADEQEALGPVRREPPGQPPAEPEEPAEFAPESPLDAEEPGDSEPELPVEATAGPALEPSPETAEPLETVEFDEGGESVEPQPDDTPPRGFDAVEDAATEQDEDAEDEDVLEETPDFLQETPEHDRLWFEQKPPRDFDFDE